MGMPGTTSRLTLDSLARIDEEPLPIQRDDCTSRGGVFDGKALLDRVMGCDPGHATRSMITRRDAPDDDLDAAGKTN